MSQIIIRSLDCALAQLRLTSQNSNNLQYVRFYRHRKPFWLPIGKTKRFRIPKKPDVPEEERVEILRLYNVYKTQFKSLRQYFKEQLMAQTTGPEVIEEQKKIIAEQHINCVKENDLWNAQVAKIREIRLAKESAEREERILNKIMRHEETQKLRLEQLDAHIRSEKENAKTFITAKNIDEAIEIAMGNIVDHNFCIDKDEKMYIGRYGKPPPKPFLVKPIPKPDKEQESIEAIN